MPRRTIAVTGWPRLRPASKQAGGPKSSQALRAIVTMLTASAVPVPAYANQWVKGNVTIVEDYTAFNSAQSLLVTLVDQAWGNGTQSNGPAVCTGRFRAVVGQQGVTQSLYDRMYATLLTVRATGGAVALWVDTSTGPECQIQIVSYGRTVI